MQALMNMEARAKSLRPVTGHLTLQETGTVVWAPRNDGHGDVFVWEEPREGMAYLVGVDPATGESQTVGKNPDRSSIQVWRQAYCDGQGVEHRARLVARVRSPFFGDGDQVAAHIIRLSRWYGCCMVVPEVNMGLHVLELLKDAGIPIYKREVPSARIGSTVIQFGFKLKDADQRRSVVEALATAIREQVIDVACAAWVHEAKMFVTAQNGREEARGGEHDDDVLCGAMCWYAMGSATVYRRKVRSNRRPRDWHHWKRTGGA
jgi:hypothetical protein